MRTNLLALAAATSTCVFLTACSHFSDPFASSPQPPAQPSKIESLADASPSKPVTPQETNVGGGLNVNMSADDKTKLSRALDKPVGKSTTWVSTSNGTSYTVVPVEKTVVGSNQFCRKYNINAVKNGQSQEIKGTACVADDSSWQSVE